MKTKCALDLIEHDLEKNAEYISNALSDRELLDMARGRNAYSAMKPNYPTPHMIELEARGTPGAWYMIEIENENRGWVRLMPVDRWEASLGIVIADPAYRGIGIGYDICNAILLHAFPVFHTVSWYTWDYNEASIMLAKKLGFHLVETIPYCGYMTATMVLEHRSPGVMYNGLKFIKGRLDDFNRTKESEINTAV